MSPATPAGKPGFLQSALVKLTAHFTTVYAVSAVGALFRRVTLL